MKVHLNGHLVDAAQASVSIFDRGFLFGDGIFESMRAVGGRVFRLERHLARLQRSAELIEMSLPVSAQQLAAAIGDLLSVNRHRDARIRLTVTRGPGRPGDYLESPGPPTVVMTSSPYRGIDPLLYERGVSVVVSRRHAIPAASIDSAIKSISRLASVLARREAGESNAFEAVHVDAGGHLTEGTASNLFLLVDGVLRTSGVADGVLPGVTREAVIDLARGTGLAVEEGPLPSIMAASATEIFLTNTSWEVLPVTRFDRRSVGDGSPGPTTLGLLDAYRDLVRRELGDA